MITKIVKPLYPSNIWHGNTYQKYHDESMHVAFRFNIHRLGGLMRLVLIYYLLLFIFVKKNASRDEPTWEPKCDTLYDVWVIMIHGTHKACIIHINSHRISSSISNLNQETSKLHWLELHNQLASLSPNKLRIFDHIWSSINNPQRSVVRREHSLITLYL